MSPSKEIAVSDEKVELTVTVPKTARTDEREVTVLVPKVIADKFPAIGQVEEIAELYDAVFGNSAEGLGVADLTRVKVPSGDSIAFSVGEDAKKTFTGVIILMQNRMNYWAQSPEESGGASAPDCFSRDAIVGKGMYGVGSKENPSGKCEGCPMAQWSDGPDGTRIPSACKPQVAVLIMIEGQAFPVMLTVPRTSMKALKDYWKRKLFMNMKHYAQIVTEFGLTKDKNAGGVAFNRITFEQGEDLGKEARMVMLSLGGQYQGILANLDTAMDTEAPAEKPARQNAAADAAAGFSIVDDEPPVDDIPWDPADAEEDFAGTGAR